MSGVSNESIVLEPTSLTETWFVVTSRNVEVEKFSLPLSLARRRKYSHTLPRESIAECPGAAVQP